MVKRLESFALAGANLNQTNSIGVTPLHAALLNNQNEAAKLLVDKNVNIKAKDKMGRTALDLAQYAHNSVALRMLEK